MDLKAPMTIEEQIARLKEHGMTITNECDAVELLSEINYYRFTGYGLQFRVNPQKSDYIQGISFEDVYQIYRFDEDLRDVLRKYIEKAEIYYRTLISYHFSIAKCVNPPYDQHYDENNFYNKKGYNEVMESFRKERNYYKDSLIVKHHKVKYNSRMPLWVIVELMSFSNTSKLYCAMYDSEKNLIAGKAGTGASTLENHLHCLSVLRNKCAHAARLYNTDFYPPAKFTKQFLRKNCNVKINSLFAYVLVLLRRLPDVHMKKAMVSDVSGIIKCYQSYIDLSLIGFPDNFENLLYTNCN
jgi:abortive infection bacteriophage resistance protein